MNRSTVKRGDFARAGDFGPKWIFCFNCVDLLLKLANNLHFFIKTNCGVLANTSILRLLFSPPFNNFIAVFARVAKVTIFFGVQTSSYTATINKGRWLKISINDILYITVNVAWHLLCLVNAPLSYWPLKKVGWLWPLSGVTLAHGRVTLAHVENCVLEH